MSQIEALRAGAFRPFAALKTIAPRRGKQPVVQAYGLPDRD